MASQIIPKSKSARRRDKKKAKAAREAMRKDRVDEKSRVPPNDRLAVLEIVDCNMDPFSSDTLPNLNHSVTLVPASNELSYASWDIKDAKVGARAKTELNRHPGEIEASSVKVVSDNQAAAFYHQTPLPETNFCKGGEQNHQVFGKSEDILTSPTVTYDNELDSDMEEEFNVFRKTWDEEVRSIMSLPNPRPRRNSTGAVGTKPGIYELDWRAYDIDDPEDVLNQHRNLCEMIRKHLEHPECRDGSVDVWDSPIGGPARYPSATIEERMIMDRRTVSLPGQLPGEPAIDDGDMDDAVFDMTSSHAIVAESLSGPGDFIAHKREPISDESESATSGPIHAIMKTLETTGRHTADPAPAAQYHETASEVDPIDAILKAVQTTGHYTANVVSATQGFKNGQAMAPGPSSATSTGRALSPKVQRSLGVSGRQSAELADQTTPIISDEAIVSFKPLLSEGSPVDLVFQDIGSSHRIEIQDLFSMAASSNPAHVLPLPSFSSFHFGAAAVETSNIESFRPVKLENLFATSTNGQKDAPRMDLDTSSFKPIDVSELFKAADSSGGTTTPPSPSVTPSLTDGYSVSNNPSRSPSPDNRLYQFGDGIFLGIPVPRPKWAENLKSQPQLWAVPFSGPAPSYVWWQ